MRVVLNWLFTVPALLLCTGLAAVAGPYGLETRPTVGPFFNGILPQSAPGESGAWTTVNAFPNLTFQNPVFLIPEPGTNRLYVGGREGYIWSFQNDPAVTTKTLFLDLHNNTQGWDDCGLMGMAFHPEFGNPASTNRGYVYVYYQFQYSTNIQGSAENRPEFTTPSYNRLSRFTVPPGSLTADPNSEVILINQFDRHVWHNGGAMFFGPDGFLYLTNGDEGDADDSYNNTQRIDGGLFSGVLRIDVNQDPTRSHPIRRQPQSQGPTPAGWMGTFSANYFIPNDNPWANPDGSVLEEFWAIGLRSPHRMTYDPVSGQVWLGDVGQAAVEEIDLIEKAGNYQWAYKEGTYDGRKTRPDTILGNDKPPVYDYVHDEGNGCVIAGYVYRGTQHASDLWGKLLFGDNSSGRIWTLTYNGNGVPPTVNLLCNMPPGASYAGGLSSFGYDQNNELYMCAMGMAGKIYKLARTGDTIHEPPALLSQVGVFSDLANLTPANGLLPYNVNMPLWSDHAAKTRWIAVPNGTQIGFFPTGEWTFPTGTVFVKHFELPTDENNPNVRKRLETRLLVKETNGAIYGVTYKWRPDNSDADLLTNSLNEDILITTSSGTRTQTWYYPSRQDCLTCHKPNANYVLGVKTRQQNGDFTYPSTGITDNQLRTWNHLGLFAPALNEADIPNYAALVHVTNTTASLENRVRSYIDANCAHCHRPNGVQANFDARYDTPLANQGIINGHVGNDLGVPGARVVVPQDPTKSLMYLRMNTTGPSKMPPLARSVIDDDAVSALGQWINSLPPVGQLPAPWSNDDVGGVGVPGEGTYASGTFTIEASGNDIWDNADSFNFTYQTMSGDGVIIARVKSLENLNTFTKAGVMIRESLAPGSRHAFMLVSGGSGTGFECRTTAGGSSLHTQGPYVTAPYWVKLVRSGSTLTGYDSIDGVNWESRGSETIAMNTLVYVGLAVCSHENGTTATAEFTDVEVIPSNSIAITVQPHSQSVAVGVDVTFSVTAAGTPPFAYQWRFDGTNISGASNSSYTLFNVQTNNAGTYSVLVSGPAGTVTSSNALLTVTVPPGGGLPAPWMQADIGAVGVAGNATYNSGVFRVNASGADIWDNADSFHFVYRPLNSDCTIVARVNRLDYLNTFTKAGLMIRETLAPGSRHAFMLVSAGSGTGFENRAVAGGSSSHTQGPYVTAPYWLKLVRNGDNVAGYDSIDGINWQLRGSATIAMSGSVYIGLAATSHDNANSTIADFDQVNLTIPATISIVNQPQSQTVMAGTNVTFSVTPGGAPPFQYQWRYNGLNIFGATESTCTVFNVQSFDAGNYSVVVSGPGGSLTSSNAVLVVTNPPTGLPSPWAHGDIGVVGLTGTTTYSSGAFTIVASGEDIWANADSFHFVYQPINGDVTVIAHLNRLDYQNTFTKAGLMMRESLAANSRHAFMLISADSGTGFERRLTTGGTSIHTQGPYVTAPYWIKLVRNGNTFTGYDSIDGVNWTQTGTDTVVMSNVVYVGMAVTAHNNATNTTASFDSISFPMASTNHPPVLAVIANQTVQSGSLVTIAAAANDPDVPTNHLTFSLNAAAPAGSSIDAINGVFTWRPTDGHIGTNQFTIRVADDGIPNLSDAKSFLITVLPRPMLNAVKVGSNQITLSWNSVAGQRYRLEYKTNLMVANWTPIAGDVTASGTTASKTDTPGSAGERYYRIVLVP